MFFTYVLFLYKKVFALTYTIRYLYLTYVEYAILKEFIAEFILRSSFLSINFHIKRTALHFYILFELDKIWIYIYALIGVY